MVLNLSDLSSLFLSKVYVLKSPEMPQLQLQPSEVHSANMTRLIVRLIQSTLSRWICYCLRHLEHTNLSTQADEWFQKILHLMLGDMKFSAIKLRPTVSIPATSINLRLHLWGLTLGTPSPCPFPIFTSLLSDAKVY
jgi:hypothetical protein